MSIPQKPNENNDTPPKKDDDSFETGLSIFDSIFSDKGIADCSAEEIYKLIRHQKNLNKEQKSHINRQAEEVIRQIIATITISNEDHRKMQQYLEAKIRSSLIAEFDFVSINNGKDKEKLEQLCALRELRISFSMQRALEDSERRRLERSQDRGLSL